MSDLKLTIPYYSQWDPDAAAHEADCGPACLAMLLNSLGGWITPDGVYAFLGPKGTKEFTTFAELIDVAGRNGLSLYYRLYADRQQAAAGLRAALDQGLPAIVLVKYAAWRAHTGNDFAWGHFVVAAGYADGVVYVHDPLYGLWQPREKGAYSPLTQALFLDGWGGFPPDENPNFACVVAGRAVPRLVDGAAPPEPPVTPPDLDPVLRRRIRALAGYIGARQPDLTDAAEAQLWRDHIGDWGAQTARHTVQSGQTLISLAIMYYGEAWRWRAIQAYNELTGEVIYVGQGLRIPLLGQSQAHHDPNLPGPDTSYDPSQDSADPTQQAVDYNDLGPLTVGIGFYNPAEAQMDALDAA